MKDLLINEEIRAKKVRLIGDDGEQKGIVSTREALDLARDKNLDLVNVAPNANPPVCKIMDYGKFKYEAIKKEKEAR
ncbi:MAG: translation initiation factor IF-3, partial [Tissierellia bacterium]|nr:translation initiation factor IF-3 [Tissierellia bacterium]